MEPLYQHESLPVCCSHYVGNGSIPLKNHPNTISIPAALGQFAGSLAELKAQRQNMPKHGSNGNNYWLAVSAIISTLNVNCLNSWLMDEFPGQIQAYESIDARELTGMLPHVIKLVHQSCNFGLWTIP